MSLYKQIGIVILLIATMFFLAYLFVSKICLAPVSSPAAESKKYFYRIPIQIVNLSETNGTRYLKIEIVIEYQASNESRSSGLFEAKKTMLIDTLIMLLSSKTISNIDGYENKEILKEEIRQKFEKVLSNDKENIRITTIYYQTFLIQ